MRTLIPAPIAEIEALRQEVEAVVAEKRRKEEPEKPPETAEAYLARIGWTLYSWQRWIYENAGANLLLVAARQVGKTFLAGGKARTKQETVPGSVTPIVCPNQEKSKILIKRIKEIVSKDREFQGWDIDNAEELGDRGASIKGLPGTLGGVVGLTAPLLMYDEAGLCGRDLWNGGTPMQAHVDNPELWVMSSAWCKDGWFWEEWDAKGGPWTKVMVRPPFDLVDHVLVDLTEQERARLFDEQREKGVHLFWSETPTRAFIELERARKSHPDWQVRQQYFCEFQEMENKIVPQEYVERMWLEGGGRKIGGLGADGSTLSEGEGRRV